MNLVLLLVEGCFREVSSSDHDIFQWFKVIIYRSMQEKEFQLQSVPEMNPHSSSLSQSTISKVIPTEPAQQRGTVPSRNKSNNKITVDRVIKFLLTIGVVISVLYFIWQSPDQKTTAASSRTYHEGVIELNQTTSKKFAWLRQKLDHFSSSDERTFYQRVFISNEGSSLRTAQPIFLFIAGLKPVSSLQESKLLQKQVKERKGISLAIETRYFGESRPFEDDSYTLDNLKYLSLEQITEDIAYAIRRIIDNRFFGITERNQWIINGANEAATIVAWVRAKYPSLTVGAVASSPRLPTVLIPLWNERIYAKLESAGKKCRIIVSKIRQNLQESLSDDRKAALAYQIGQGVELTSDEILYFYQRRIDVITREAYIYNCYYNPETTLLKSFTKIILSQQAVTFEPLGLSQRVLASVDDWLYFQAVRSARANWYLRCTQTGFFEISSNRSFSSPRINQEFFRERCKSIFGASLWPDPKPVLQMYQPYLSTATNLLIVHGFYDPYLPYALKGSSPKSETIVAKCLGCEGLVDYLMPMSKIEAIEDVLAKEAASIDRWLRKS